MFVVLSKFAVDDTSKQADMIAAVKAAFVERPHRVDEASGFVRLDVLSPLHDPAEIWLLTYWRDRASFDAWHRTHRYQESHVRIPGGLRLLRGRTGMLFFEHVGS